MMYRRLGALIVALPLSIASLVASLVGSLIALMAFAGHPPEWILDAYYSIYPSTATGGVIILFAVIGLLSACLFCVALVLIFLAASDRTESDRHE